MVQNKQQTISLNARELYMHLISSYQRMAKYLGFDIYRENFSITWRLIVACVFTLFAITNGCVMIVTDPKSDPGEFLISIVFFGCVIQVLMVFHNYTFLK